MSSCCMRTKRKSAATCTPRHRRISRPPNLSGSGCATFAERLRRSAAKGIHLHRGQRRNDIDVVATRHADQRHAEVASEALPAGKTMIIGKLAELN